MSNYKMVFVAVALMLAWVGVGAVSFANLATVQPNLQRIAQQRGKPAPSPAAAPGAAPVLVARSEASAP